MNPRKVLVTAGLPYSNGRPHVGHVAGALLPADIYARFERLRGSEVLYVCGSDDHGVAILLAAEKEGMTPQELADHYHDLQVKAFRGIDLEFDIYSSTSRNPEHAPMCQSFFRSMNEKGYFEKKVSRQFYDEKKQMFLADRYVKGTCGYCGTPDQYGDQCENCGKILDVDSLKSPRSTVSGEPVSTRETLHWFLDLSKWQPQIEEWLSHAEVREGTRNFVEGILKQGLVQRAITRDLSWGVPVPVEGAEAEGKVLYVWFDAPIGYISNTLELLKQRGESEKQLNTWWKNPETKVVHFIGEDNAIFHCVIWIAMLAAEGSYQLPDGVIVNQFLNIQFPDQEVEKISKSRGKAVWVEDYIDAGGSSDVLRYYLCSIAPERARTVYQPQELIQKNNSELGNTLGNFVNRILTFTHKNYGPNVPALDTAGLTEIDEVFQKRTDEVLDQVGRLLESYQLKTALFEVMEYARACNKYVDDLAPWKTRKTDEVRTKSTLNLAIQAISALGVLLAPFMPQTSKKIRQMLSLPEVDTGDWKNEACLLKAGAELGAPVILFERMEEDVT